MHSPQGFVGLTALAAAIPAVVGQVVSTSSSLQSNFSLTSVRPSASPLPTNFCCEMLADGVGLNFWWNKTQTAYTATVVTQYVVYNNTVLTEYETMTNDNPPIGSIPPDIIGTWNEYRGTVLANRSTIATYETTTVASPTPHLVVDAFMFFTGTYATNTQGATTCKIIGGPKDRFGLPTEYVYVEDPPVTRTDSAFLPPPPTDILQSLTKQNIRLTDEYPYISDCPIVSGTGQPTVHIPITALTSYSSTTISRTGVAPAPTTAQGSETPEPPSSTPNSGTEPSTTAGEVEPPSTSPVTPSTTAQAPPESEPTGPAGPPSDTTFNPPSPPENTQLPPPSDTLINPPFPPDNTQAPPNPDTTGPASPPVNTAVNPPAPPEDTPTPPESNPTGPANPPSNTGVSAPPPGNSQPPAESGSASQPPDAVSPPANPVAPSSAPSLPFPIVPVPVPSAPSTGGSPDTTPVPGAVVLPGDQTLNPGQQTTISGVAIVVPSASNSADDNDDEVTAVADAAPATLTFVVPVVIVDGTTVTLTSATPTPPAAVPITLGTQVVSLQVPSASGEGVVLPNSETLSLGSTTTIAGQTLVASVATSGTRVATVVEVVAEGETKTVTLPSAPTPPASQSGKASSSGARTTGPEAPAFTGGAVSGVGMMQDWVQIAALILVMLGLA